MCSNTSVCLWGGGINLSGDGNICSPPPQKPSSKRKKIPALCECMYVRMYVSMTRKKTPLHSNIIIHSHNIKCNNDNYRQLLNAVTC